MSFIVNQINRLKGKRVQDIIEILLFKFFLNLLLRFDLFKFLFFGRRVVLFNKKQYRAEEYKKLLFLRASLWGEKKDLIDKKLRKTYIESVIDSANSIINGNTPILGKRYVFPKYNWHFDPITKDEWPKNIFFSKAKVEMPALADVKFVLEYNKFHHLVHLAQAYFYTNHIKYYNEVDSQISSWIEQNSINSSVVWKIKLDLAFRNINLVLIVFLLLDAPDFSEKLLPKILGMIAENVKQIKRYSSAKWFKSHKGGNHKIGELIGIIIPMLIFESLFKSTSLKRYLRQLDDALVDTISDDGVYLEQSAGYSKLVAEFLIYLDIFLKLLGKKGTIVFQNKLEGLLKYLYTIQNKSKLPNFGDSDGAKLFQMNKCFFDISHILFYGKNELGLPFILDSAPEGMNWFGKPYDNAFRKKEIERKKPKVINHLNGGQFVYKSNDESDVYFFTRYGPHSYGEHGKGSHAHNDLLSIIMSIKGKELFIDKGTYLYNSGISTRNADRSTASHNTINIDNIEQAEFMNKWSYKNYPKLINTTDISRQGSVFNKKIIYNNVHHTRSIYYKNESIIIIDTVFNNTNYSISGHISYLLSSSIVCNKENHNRVNLSMNEEFLCKLECENIREILIDDFSFSRIYSSLQETKKIWGGFKVENNKELIITTKISLNDD